MVLVYTTVTKSFIAYYYLGRYCTTMDNQRPSTRQHCHNNHSPVVDLQRSYLLASVASQDTTEQWPRRGSLPNPTPIFKTKHFGHIQVSLSRPPSTEILHPNTHSRLQDTPVQIRYVVIR